MFQQNTLQRLYPHLNFNRVEPPSVSRSASPIPVRSSSVSSAKTNISQKNDEPPIVEVKPAEVKTPEPLKEEPRAKKVKISPPPLEKVEKLEVPKIEEVKPVKRPNRTKVEPKPEPVRESQIPVKGERGLQRRYTEEQRKNIYLERLSRKSIKNAEKEIVKVNEVLESVEHNPEKLKIAEREVKSRLKLINYAKYFTNSTNINNDKTSKPEETNTRGSVLKKSKGSEVSKDIGGANSQPISDVGRRGSGSESSGSDDESGASSSDSD